MIELYIIQPTFSEVSLLLQPLQHACSCSAFFRHSLPVLLSYISLQRVHMRLMQVVLDLDELCRAEGRALSSRRAQSLTAAPVCHVKGRKVTWLVAPVTGG